MCHASRDLSCVTFFPRSIYKCWKNQKNPKKILKNIKKIPNTAVRAGNAKTFLMAYIIKNFKCWKNPEKSEKILAMMVGSGNAKKGLITYVIKKF